MRFGTPGPPLSSLALGIPLSVAALGASSVAATGALVLDCAPTGAGVHWVGALPLDTRSLEISGTTVYAVRYGGVSVIDGSDPAHPREVRMVNLEASPRDILLSGSLLFASSDGWEEGTASGVAHVIDVTDPQDPHVRGRFTAENLFPGMLLGSWGNRVYLERDNEMRPTLFVLDVSDPDNNPYAVDVEDLPPLHEWGRFAVFQGPAGPLAYVPVAGEGLHIVDLSSDAPVLQPQVLVPGAWDRVAIAPSGEWGVAVGPNAGRSLHIVMLDLADPLHPVVAGSLDPPPLGFVPDTWWPVTGLGVTDDLVAVAWDNATFLARPRPIHGIAPRSVLEDRGCVGGPWSPGDVAITEGHLWLGSQVYERRQDRSERSITMHLGAPPNATAQLTDLEVVGDYAYEVQYVDPGNYGWYWRWLIVDLSDPGAPANAGTLVGEPLSRSQLVYSRGFLFAWHDRDLATLSLANATSPVEVASSELFPEDYLSYVAADITPIGTRLVAALQAWPSHWEVAVVDVQDPLQPRLTGRADLVGRPRAVAAVGGFAYLACGVEGVAVVDLAGGVPVVRGYVATSPREALDVVIADGVAYVALGAEGLLPLDLADPGAPVASADVPVPNTAYALAVKDDMLYVAGSWAGVTSMRIDDPLSPALVGTVTCASNPDGLRPVAQGVLAYNGASVIETLRPDCAAVRRNAVFEDFTPRTAPPAVSAFEVFPTPTRGELEVRFDPGEARPRAALRIYDVAGRMVRSLVEDAHAVGRGRVRWDGCNVQGRLVAPGVYFVRLEAGDQVRQRKIVVMR